MTGVLKSNKIPKNVQDFSSFTYLLAFLLLRNNEKTPYRGGILEGTFSLP
jgi:hypothetical protein